MSVAAGPRLAQSDPKLAKLRTALDERVGEAQLPELILAVDAQVRFSWIMLGREPRSAKANVSDWEGSIREKPSQVVIQTWSPNPVRIVPEDDPTTMTGYLKWFVERGGK